MVPLHFNNQKHLQLIDLNSFKSAPSIPKNDRLDATDFFFLFAEYTGVIFTVTSRNVT